MNGSERLRFGREKPVHEEIGPSAEEVGPGKALPIGPTATRGPSMRTVAGTRSTSFQQRTRPIGGTSPAGILEDIKDWWSQSPTWQKGVVIGLPLVLLLALTGGKKEETPKKI